MSYADRKREESDVLAGDRHEAEEFECPDCGAAVGERCHHSDGVPLGRAPAHPQRITLVRLSRPASGPSDSNGGG